jgi:hypothetical protein
MFEGCLSVGSVISLFIVLQAREENATSSEFDQFLIERARDNERLPADDGSSRNAAVSSGQHQHHSNELVSL